MKLEELLKKFENCNLEYDVRIHYQIKGRHSGVCAAITDVIIDEHNEEIVLEIPYIEI